MLNKKGCLLFRPHLDLYQSVIMWFLFEEVSSSSGCLGWATLFIVALPEHSISLFRLTALLKLGITVCFLWL